MVPLFDYNGRIIVFMSLKRTPLYAVHLRLGGRMVDFGGWEMPVQYSGILDEHRAVRTAAGLFDISHMGQASIGGPRAKVFLNNLLTNDINKLTVGHGQYTLMCNPQGGAIDDLIVYCVAPDRYWLIINASRAETDLAWIHTQLALFSGRDGVHLENYCGKFGAVALQGPRSRDLIDTCLTPNTATLSPTGPASRLVKNQIGSYLFKGGSVWAASTGYTGEDGFEIFAPSEKIESLWNDLMAAGAAVGIKPAGLGARDTLRTEAGYPLYGHELDEHTSPLEACLGRFVALGKSEFIGREVLVQQKEQGISKQLVGFKMTGKSAPPRPHYPIWTLGPEAAQIGRVVSGTQSPSLGIGIGMAYVPPSHAAPGTPLAVEIRGQMTPAVVVKRPIYKSPV